MFILKRYIEITRKKYRKERQGERDLKLENMLTETRNPNTMNLDRMTPLEIVKAMGKRVITIQKGTLVSDSLTGVTGGGGNAD